MVVVVVWSACWGVVVVVCAGSVVGVVVCVGGVLSVSLPVRGSLLVVVGVVVVVLEALVLPGACLARGRVGRHRERRVPHLGGPSEE